MTNLNLYEYEPVDLNIYSERFRKKIKNGTKYKIAAVTDNEAFKKKFNKKFFEAYINQNNFTEEKLNSVQKSLPILSTLVIPIKGSQTSVLDNYKKTLERMEGEIIFKSVFNKIHGISRSNLFMYLNREPELAMVRGVYKMNNELYNNNQLINNKYKTYTLVIYGYGKSKVAKTYEIDFEFPRIFNKNEYINSEDIDNLIINYDNYDKQKDEEKKNLIIKYLNILLPEEDAIDETNADTINEGIENIKNYLSTKEGKQKLEENLLKKIFENKSLRNLENYKQYKNAMDKLFKIHFEKKYPDLFVNDLEDKLILEMRDFYERIFFASNNPMVNGKQIDKIVDDDFIENFSNLDESERLVIFKDLLSEVDSKFIYRQAINKVINDFVNKEIDSNGNIVYKGFKEREELSKTDFAKEGVTSDYCKKELKKALENEVFDASYSFSVIDKYSTERLDELPKVLVYVIDEITEIDEEFINNVNFTGEVMNDLDFKERLEKVKELEN